jgi:hypothetical protein
MVSVGVSVEIEDGAEMSWNALPRLPDSTSFAQRSCKEALLWINGALW